MKVARGRSWQPEIGMEHASRGRRSGNKGVGARWRGRFRIFSARHCSRTKVSHAENSGMTMLFFSWRLLQCRRGILSHPLMHPARDGPQRMALRMRRKWTSPCWMSATRDSAPMPRILREAADLRGADRIGYNWGRGFCAEAETLLHPPPHFGDTPPAAHPLCIYP